MLSLSSATRIFVALVPMDMRRGFDTYITKYDTAGNAQWVTSGGGSGD
jgi:hypothetical protein